MAKGIEFSIAGAILAPLCLLLAWGCGHAGATYAGSWIGHRAIAPNPRLPDAVLRQASDVTVTIKLDGSFTMEDAGIPKEGTVEYRGNLAYLHVERIMGEPVSQLDQSTRDRNVPIRLSPEGAGLRFFDPEGFDATGVLLSRVPPKRP